MYKSISLEPIQDSFLNSWEKEQNFSNLDHYFLGFFNGAINYRILLKFDLNDLPLESEITEATLKLYCVRNDCKEQEKNYNVFPVTQEWSSKTVNWLSQPAYYTLGKVQVSVDSQISEYITLDITQIVSTWLHYPNSNYGIIVMAANENEQESLLGFLSSRQEYPEWRPRLELTVQVPDKPIISNSISRVAILTPQFFEWSGERCLFGGGERYLIDFANLLQKLGYQVDVFQPSMGSEWEKIYNGVKIMGIGDSGLDKDFCIEVNKTFFQRAKDYNIHIYFNLNVIYPYVFPGSICISHGIWWDSIDRPWWRTEPWYQRFLVGLKNIETLVSVDTNTIKWFNSVMPDPRLQTVYIPNYVDLDCINSSHSDRGDYITILYPRRLHSCRGIEICKDVAKELVIEHENLRFMFVGRGSEEDEKVMHQFAAKYPRIEYDWYDMKEIYKVYQDVDIVLIPSLSSEGTSLSLIEAMAFGKPVIAGLVGGITDLILPGYNGLLIDVTHENLKKTILELVGNPDLRHTLGENARVVAEHFSKAIWEERWKKVILDHMARLSLGLK